mgnify:FL=1
MKVVLAEKPSVAQSIARIVGANQKKDGFYEGNGWQVTYAFGHLIQLAMPESYGYNSWSKGNLPMLPKEFIMIPRQKKEGKTYKNDPGVMKQLKIIKHLFEQADEIIGATDSAREGEAILRYIVNYLDIKKPIMRLWINSLTDAAIKDGLSHLHPDSNYDNLFLAAKARSEADWLVGMNATQACSIMGKSLYSIGRVQTPTLVMIVDRYLQNKEFKSIPFWQVALNTTDSVKLTSAGKWDEKAEAERAYNTVSKARSGKVVKAEKKQKTELPPLLFSLTDLQKAANSKYGYSADKTLNIAQSLYEKQLISYPRTGSSYIPDDVYDTIPELLKNTVFDKFREAVNAIEKPSKRSVDASKIEDHHALLVTGVNPKSKDIKPDEQVVYDMILGRMVEAFSKPCEKEVSAYTVDAGGYLFTVSATIIIQKGWRAVCGADDKEKTNIPVWIQDETVCFTGAEMQQGQTKPKPLHTEGTLLAAMETCGKDIDDEAQREAIKDCGIGTPATRAGIIETLVARNYIVREKKSLVPTAKGLEIYKIVKDKDIANASLTGQWEAKLAAIERGKMNVDEFNGDIVEYTKHVTNEFLHSDLKPILTGKQTEIECPLCHQGHIRFFDKVANCSNEGCNFHIFRTILGKKLTNSELTDLILKGQTRELSGFKCKDGKPFKAKLRRDDKGGLSFVFNQKK